MSAVVVKRGCLIAFEGVDRCGKSTQTQRLLAALTAASGGGAAELMRFPDRSTESGKEIDAYLKGSDALSDEQAHLLFARNRWESAERIRTLLEKGTHVILDRYAFSGVCYTAAKAPRDKKRPREEEEEKEKEKVKEKEEEKEKGKEKEQDTKAVGKEKGPLPLSIEWCKIPDKGLPAPDLVLLLDMKVEKLKLRADFGAERYEKVEFLERVRENFLSIADSKWKIIDASRSIEEVEQDVRKAVFEVIEAVSKAEKAPIAELW